MEVTAKKTSIIAGSLIAICLGAFVVVIIRGSSQDTSVLSENTTIQLQQINDDTNGISLGYPSSWHPSELSTLDTKDGFVFRFESYNPPALISVRRETGLQTAAALSRLDVLDLLISNVAKSYPARFEGYVLETELSKEIDGKQSREVVFTYSGPSGERIKQKLLIIKQGPGEAVYVSMQSEEGKYESIEATLNQVESSILVR